ncbi:MAG: hypothetical protein HY548_05815 [Elusimicrobia bacterium]|nr:hypothetical protein [Elusimicrobiota bacterium]
MSVFQNITGTETVFWVFAFVGTLFFLLRVAAMVVGGFGEDVHADAGGAEAGHSSSLEASNAAFKLLSINSLTGFFMMFGWAGLSAYKQFHLGPIASFLAAFGAGLGAMVATAYLFKIFVRLNSPGDVYSVNLALGMNATVYQRIPANGRGRIQVIVGGVTRYIDAVSEEPGEIASFVDVSVVRVVDPRTVAVREAKK